MVGRIPLPRRGLRSVGVAVLLIVGTYVLLDRFASDSDRLAHVLAQSASHARLDARRDVDRWIEEDDSGMIVQDPGVAHDKEQMPYRVSASNFFSPPGGRGKDKVISKILQRPQHSYLDNGLLTVNPKARHPIYDLLERSKDAWTDKLSRASRTLEQAEREYRRRYSRAPPRGFDRWWAYAQKNNVQLPDEYDQINQDLEPFQAITPSQLRDLVNKVKKRSGMYTISCPGRQSGAGKAKCTAQIVKEGLNEEGTRVADQRAAAQLSLLEDIWDDLEPVDAVFYSHDVPWQFVGHEFKSALEDQASVGEFFFAEEHEIDMAHLGWASACAPHKPLRSKYDITTLPDLEGIWQGKKSFIWNHKAAMDPCTHPTLTHLVGFLSGHGKGPRPAQDLYPVMAMCKTTLHADVLAVSMEAWTEDVGNDPAWEQKTDDRLFWRGSTTGILWKNGVPWNISQRANLISHTQRKTGLVPILPVHDEEDLAVGEPEATSFEKLNSELTDVAFTGNPMQCHPQTCEVMKQMYHFGSRKNWNQGNLYKYHLDLDGNGWSARFKRLMSTNSVVLKSTIFPEWYTHRVQPWVHYIPIKADLTDLYDVLAFFRGGHDHLAKEIAAQGKQWSKTFWRKEDMVAYQYRLFLELARLMSPDRASASYHGS